jgi:hypothetical protein
MVSGSRWIRRSGAAAVAVLGVLAVVGRADAQGDVLTEARQHHERGLELASAGQYEEAILEFHEAERLAHSPVNLFNEAWCFGRLGRACVAVEILDRYLAEAGNLSAEDRADGERLRERLLADAPGLVTVRSHPPGAAVSVDDRPADVSTPARVELSPGEYQVELTLEDHETAEARVAVAACAESELTLDLEPVPSEPVPSEPVPGGLSIRVEPGDNAAVTVDDRPWTSDGDLAPGTYQVRVTAPHRIPWSGQVHVRPGEEARLDVDLARRGINQAWFWSLLGLSLVTSASLTATGVLAYQYRDRWVEYWQDDVRETGESFQDATDALLGVLAGEVVAAIIVGSFTRFRRRESSGTVEHAVLDYDAEVER